MPIILASRLTPAVQWASALAFLASCQFSSSSGLWAAYHSKRVRVRDAGIVP